MQSSYFTNNYSPEIGSLFDQDQIVRRGILAEEIDRENRTQLVGNLITDATYEVRKNLTEPEISYFLRRQSIYDYSDIVL